MNYEDLLKSSNKEDILLGILMACKELTKDQLKEKFPHCEELEDTKYPVDLINNPIAVESDDFIIYAEIYIEFGCKTDLKIPYQDYVEYMKKRDQEVYKL